MVNKSSQLPDNFDIVNFIIPIKILYIIATQFKAHDWEPTYLDETTKKTKTK